MTSSGPVSRAPHPAVRFSSACLRPVGFGLTSTPPPAECAFRRPSTASTTSATSTPQAGLLQAVMCRLRERIEALTHEVAELRDENSASVRIFLPKHKAALTDTH